MTSASRRANSNDPLTPQARSRLMARVRRSGTAPEKWVARFLRRAGYRYRRQVKGLTGTPDFVIPGCGAVIFVHGCFWHQHGTCRPNKVPVRNARLWESKFRRNVSRDRRVCRALRAAGWSVITVWECETSKKSDRLETRLRRILGPPAANTLRSGHALLVDYPR